VKKEHEVGFEHGRDREEDKRKMREKTIEHKTKRQNKYQIKRITKLEK
jgi:hypothetical protein